MAGTEPDTVPLDALPRSCGRLPVSIKSGVADDVGMGTDRTAIILATVVVVICVAGTLTAFGIGRLLDEGDAFPSYDVSGTASDGSGITGTATCRDTGESSTRPVLMFEYSLATADDDAFTLTSYLFLDEDGSPVGALYTNVGTATTLDTQVTLWRDSSDEYTYHVDLEGNVLAVDIRVDGIVATAVQATP